jgi:hypothetical protein
MSRCGYTDDYEYPQLCEQWVSRATWGKRGQAMLRKLKQALEELPQKRLIADEFKTEQGEYCAIATLLEKEGKIQELQAQEYSDDDADQYEANEYVAGLLNVSPVLIRQIEFENDEMCICKTPEERYQYMLHWVNRNLYKEEVA